MEKKRVFLIVLDSVGIGEMPDAKLYGDEGANTLGSVLKGGAVLDNLKKMGLLNIDGVVQAGVDYPSACFARLAERSKGKDTTIGHWEIGGVISEEPLPVFPDGFPQELIERFEAAIGRKVLCNKPYSGTQVIMDYGREHIETGAVIVYTSADSVFQVAAHEDVVPIEELYRICDIARELLTGEYAVGRVIARPFEGEYPAFRRTSRRHDVSLAPRGRTMLDALSEAGKDVIAVGKIYDIFAGRGVTKSMKTANNTDGIQKTLDLTEESFDGIAFVNLVDFDMVYGHRNDVEGYGKALMEFDSYVPNLLEALSEDDLLIITADHGCDPGYPGTDHTREYVPMLVAGKGLKQGVNLGTLSGFDHIAALVLDWLGVPDAFIEAPSVLPSIKQ